MAKSPKTFTSHSPPRARRPSGSATRRRSTRELLQSRNRAFGPNGVPTTSRQTSATRTDTTSRLPISLGSTNKKVLYPGVIMPAFLVFIREKTLDQSELKAYWAKIRATMEGHPIKVLAAYGRHVTLEGPEVEGVVVAEFPSVEEARAFYDSPAYQDAAQHRFRGAVYRGVIVEGI